MCGRYTLRRIDLIRAAADATATLPFDEFSERPRYNIAPGQDVPVVRMEEGRRVLSLARWGLIPRWAKETPKVRPINARAETVETSGMFRDAFGRRRCLIPADGFYEWQAAASKGVKQPYFIRLRDEQPFAFAGLWERWRPPESDLEQETCAILTTEPNELMRPIHNRMPVILARRDYATWLNLEAKAEELRLLLRPFDAREMAAYPISTRVNRPGNDGPELIERESRD
jgi:putative SOS response-associated peptidase YedK